MINVVFINSIRTGDAGSRLKYFPVLLTFKLDVKQIAISSFSIIEKYLNAETRAVE